MKRQSRRATLLTLLAAFYLPLSLVTSIFGMSLKEFDDVRPSVALCFEALFAIVAVTAVIYGLFRYLPLVFHPLRNSSSIIIRTAVFPFYPIWRIFYSLEKRRKRLSEDIALEKGLGNVKEG
jgi:hypothetical protein